MAGTRRRKRAMVKFREEAVRIVEAVTGVHLKPKPPANAPAASKRAKRSATGRSRQRAKTTAAPGHGDKGDGTRRGPLRATHRSK
jgi:hypothetical protein